jgi:predicted PurR-regulated permease PerM
MQHWVAMARSTEPDAPTASALNRTPLPSARTVTAAVLVIGLLYAGREFFIPVALAALLTALLRPAVRWLEHRRLPTALGATIVMVLTISILAGVAWGLSVPAQGWAAKIPQSVAAAQAKLAQLRRSMQQVTKVAEQLQNPGQQPAGAPAGATRGGQQAPPPAAPTPPVAGYVARALGTTTSFIMGMVEVLLLSWLALASGDLFYEKLMRVLPRAADKRVAAKVASESERVVGGYVLASALINVGQAIAVGLALWLIKMPDPVLWAMACFVLEFIPYLGGTLMVGLLAIVGLTTFDSPGHILAAPGAYLTITTLQNNLVSPLVYGHRLRLNPVAVLVAVMFWWTLWGVAGAFLAVPIVAALSVIGRHVSEMRPLSEFLSD